MAYCQGCADDPDPLSSVLIALLCLVAAFGALGAAAPYLPPSVPGRAGATLVLLGIALVVAALLFGPATLEAAGLRARIDGLGGTVMLALLIALAPSFLLDSRHAASVAACAMLTILAHGVLAVLALAGLCLTL